MNDPTTEKRFRHRVIENGPGSSHENMASLVGAGKTRVVD
jgi:hypothetical protein